MELGDAGTIDDWERLATNLRVEGALLRALDALDDLPVVIFKGALLTRLVYGDLRVRASADNDLWVEKAHAEEALTRLLQAGYQALPEIDPHRALARYGQVALWPSGDLDAVSLDLHQEPFSGRLFQIEEDLLKAHLMAIPLHDRVVWTFDKPLSLVHLVAHFVQHRLERNHLPILGAAWDNWSLDEGTLRSLARSTCTEEALEYSLSLTHSLGHAQRPPPAVTTARAKMLTRVHGPNRRERGASVQRLLSLALVSPGSIPRETWRNVFLDEDDFASRFGRGCRGAHILRRLHELLAR